MEKEQVILRFVKINKILKRARYLIDTGTMELDIEECFPELIHIGEWAEEIQAHWEVSKDDYTTTELSRLYAIDKYSKASVVPDLISAALKLYIEGSMPTEYREALHSFIDAIGELRKSVEEYQRNLQGKYYGLPSELHTNEAITLLNECFNAGLLDEHYQPTADTKRFQLKLIAFGMSKKLNLPQTYSLFEQFWQLNNLKSIPIPETKNNEIQKVKEIFPGVCFQPSNTEMRRIFQDGRSKETLSKMLSALIHGNYIDSSHKLNDWMAIFGKENPEQTYLPINWIAGPFKLGQFIDKAFGRDNSNCLWEVAKYNFRIGGNKPNIGSMKEGASKANRNGNHDQILISIANTG